MQGKFGVDFEKKEIHRAFDDIQASVAELQYYLEWFKTKLWRLWIKKQSRIIY